jgi:hypothetical protein
MKLTSFNCTIELSKDENGYSNNYYVDVTDKGVSISHPYVVQSQEQVMFVTNLIHDFIAASIAFNNRVDRFNFDNHLEQYAPKVSVSETSSESASPQTCALGDEEISTGIKDAPFEEVETAMDKAKTPEEVLEAMIASGERKEVRDLPM